MKLRIYILFLLPLITTGLHAQTLRGLQENPVIKKNLSDQPVSVKSAQAKAILTLPFFEDFSTSSVFPDPEKWTDRYAFVNNSFGISPVSFGVATLDAIDENGDVYALTNQPASSDRLTSQEFNLSAYAGETVRMSFFYQSGGNGETPEFNDSLILEFYYPSSGLWKRDWYASTNTPSDFKQVIRVLPDSCLTLGFRFRFRNYTSISAKEVSGGEGALSNADCWNIDYIMMNTDPEFNHRTINNDFAVADIPRRLLDFYETIPWLHLNDAQSITRNTMFYQIRNFLPEGDLVNIGRSYYLRDLNAGYIEDYEPFFEELPTDSLVHVELPFFAPFSRKDDSDEGLIEVGSYIITQDGPKENDTSRIVLHFKDTYAYDDGVPEYGFGIEGPSMIGALLALRFRLFKSDTLRAVDMLFNKARDLFNEDLKFQLCVWKDDGGLPGDLIYMSAEEYSPDFGTALPGFRRYPIMAPDDLLITDSVIYVGWKQLTDEFLNLGYDVNRNNLSRTFVNVAGDWINPGGSLIPGTVMIRAAFGSEDVITDTPEIPVNSTEVVIYPNPVSHILNIGSEGMNISQITMVDITGRIVLQQTGDHQRVDVSSMASGVYQLILSSGNRQPIIHKIVVRH